MNPKWNKHKDPDYIAWIKSQRCVVCAREKPDPHHVERARRNDYMAIPLCRKHHTELHALENKPGEWETKYNINLYWTVITMLGEYLHGKR